MKNIKTLALVLILVVSTMALFACNPSQDDNEFVGVEGIYVNHESSKEFTSYEVAISAIPKDWSLYAPATSSNEFKNSHSGYIKELDAFVVKKTIETSTYLGIIKCGTTDVLFENLAITAIRVSNGSIILKNVNGDMYVTDFDGKVVLKDIVSGAGNKAIDEVIRVLDDELVAVNPLYDANAVPKLFHYHFLLIRNTHGIMFYNYNYIPTTRYFTCIIMIITNAALKRVQVLPSCYATLRKQKAPVSTVWVCSSITKPWEARWQPILKRQYALTQAL